MSVSIRPPLNNPAPDDFCQRWPLHKYPGLHLSVEEVLALRRRQRQRRQLLDLLGSDIADIAAAILEESNGYR